jgi:hypothetical protein
LIASGLIVGESLFGVILAGVIVATKNPSPFALAGDSFQPIAKALGAITFVLVIVALYRWTAGLAQQIKG